MPTKQELKDLQKYPLEYKVWLTQNRIREWVDYYGMSGVYVSFSGGKDSTVLLHIVRQMYPDIEAVFVNTGLEYPEIQSFVKTFDNVTILRPKMRFDEVIRKYGYPFISKETANCVRGARNGSESRINRLNGLNCDGTNVKTKFSQGKWKPLLNVDFLISENCCNVTKKSPIHIYEKRSGKYGILATMTEESQLRQTNWLKTGCNSFEGTHIYSAPMSFWTEQDILQYIKQNNLPLASVYGDIVYGNRESAEKYNDLLCDCGQKLCTTKCERTGCIFCGFGAHLEKGESRFQRLKKTHPRQYEYCMGGGAYQWRGKVKPRKKWRYIDFINENGQRMSDEEIEKYVQQHIEDKNYHFEKVWMPTKNGLGLAHCIDELNKIYGKDFIRY